MEAAGAAALVAVAAALPLLVPGGRPFVPAEALALVACLALASRIRLYVGAGFGMPSQLVLVPMLFLLPVSAVPAAVAAGLAAGACSDVVRGRAHPERLLTAVNDAWYTVGGALVVIAAGQPPADLVALPVAFAALGAQAAVDLLTTTVRERIGRGIPADLQAKVIALVYLIDLLLTPIAVLTAAVSGPHPLAILAVLPLLALLAMFAHERRCRLEDAVQRLDALDEQHGRLQQTLRRVGDAFAANLDSDALVALALCTVTDAVQADEGLLLSPGDSAGGALDVAVAQARLRGGLAASSHAGMHALAQPLRGTAGDRVLVVARHERPFGADEHALLGQLVTQVAVALENVELHERLRTQATTDELTGLSNHRRFQQRLAAECDRARRTGDPLALVLLDVDDFKAVNDTHGHQTGDEVLRQIARVLRARCRSTDEAARYGGEELAVVLPATDLGGAQSIAEAIRRGLHTLAIPTEGSQPLRVTASLGVAALGRGCSDPAALIAHADAALYTAKRTGKDRTVASRPSTRFSEPAADPAHA